jgi:hypothetical protein
MALRRQPLHAAWMKQLLGGPLPAEPDATCDDCAMWGAGDSGAIEFFRRDTKCCTFWPVLPSFLAGGILAAGGPGQLALRRVVESKVAVSPLGVGCPASYATLYNRSGLAFGRNRALRCPYYLPDAGSCSIWRHRMSSCIAYHCKHVRGARGKAFWDSLQPLLAAVERQLVIWCALELGLDGEALCRLITASPEAPEALQPEHLDPIAPASYPLLWGRWHQREERYFRACARLVAPLSWKQVAAIGGAQVRALSRITRLAFARLTEVALPRAATVGRFEILAMTADTVRITSYSRSDPLDLPPVLLRALPAFDGRPIRAVLRALAADADLVLEEDLVRKLLDFEILLPVAAELTER